jgi:hypothetical protein
VFLLFFSGFIVADLPTTAEQEKRSFIVDGIHINADTVEYLLKYGKELYALLFGAPIAAENARIGAYPYGGQMHSIYTFTFVEEVLCAKYANNSDFTIGLAWEKLRELLEQIKEDVFKRSVRFFGYLRRHRLLFQEAQEQLVRKVELDRPCVLVLDKILPGNEEELFREHITSFAQLYDFCTCTLTFLHEMIELFPNARAQFIERVTKWQRIKEFFIDIQFDLELESEFDEMAFFRHIKKHNLDLLLLGEITREQVVVMLQEFMNTEFNG